MLACTIEVVNGPGRRPASSASAAGAQGLGGAGLRRPEVPLLLEVPEMPDGQGDPPGDHEQADNGEAGGVDVEALDERPEATVEMAFPRQEAHQFDGADEEGHEDREPGDGEVVI